MEIWRLVGTDGALHRIVTIVILHCKSIDIYRARVYS